MHTQSIYSLSVNITWIMLCHCDVYEHVFSFVRFSSSKVLLWIHSLFFSLLFCIFLIQPTVVTIYALLSNP